MKKWPDTPLETISWVLWLEITEDTGSAQKSRRDRGLKGGDALPGMKGKQYRWLLWSPQGRGGERPRQEDGG